MVNLATFGKTEDCGQTVLPDRSILIGQKLVENAKNEKLKWDILGTQKNNFVIKMRHFYVIFKHCDTLSGSFSLSLVVKSHRKERGNGFRKLEAH